MKQGNSYSIFAAYPGDPRWGRGEFCIIYTVQYLNQLLKSNTESRVAVTRGAGVLRDQDCCKGIFNTTGRPNTKHLPPSILPFPTPHTKAVLHWSYLWLNTYSQVNVWNGMCRFFKNLTFCAGITNQQPTNFHYTINSSIPLWTFIHLNNYKHKQVIHTVTWEASMNCRPK